MIGRESRGIEADVPKRKKRKDSSVMGWLLRRQLSEPGAGVCCAFSIAEIRGRGLIDGGRRRLESLRVE